MKAALLDVASFSNIVANIHRASMGKSPTGKFGFAVLTHLADVPNDNTWQDTWEEWFTQAMQLCTDSRRRRKV